MDQKQELNSRPDAVEARARWSRPEVDRLIAGGAEGSADISVDGLDNPS